jgi:hypothetical protein
MKMMMTTVKWFWRRYKQFINFPKLFWSDWSSGNLQSICSVTRPRFKPISDASQAVLCYVSIIGYSGFEVLTACSRLKVSRLFGGICYLYLQGRRLRQVRNHLEIRWEQSSRWLICSAYSSALNMKATCFSEMAVDLQRPTRISNNLSAWICYYAGNISAQLNGLKTNLNSE